MDLKYFKLEIQEKILIAYFDNSKQLNCFGISCAKEFEKINKFIKKNKIEGFILASKEKFFCSGGNLSDYAKLKNKSQGIKINKEITKILNDFSKIPVPTTCLVSGDCLGGGIEWISIFDTIYATPAVTFGMWQRRIGLTWGWGGGHHLKKRISKKILMNLLLSGENFSSYKAKEIGLIDEVYPQEFLLDKALAFMKSQKDLPKIAFSKAKSSELVDRELKHEQQMFQSLWLNPEHQRLLRRFR